ncbi:hypothetical protein ACFQBY_07310 [Promicromonospora citrea]|uniref:Uncharacterized protein n=1 Tax=Promicromonospora citrea TaxID=43677 RepID=A0A8H9L837_9MICO|nr:hypothetical protein [Promicromonospora citrea]NNH51344.1 hypothetical protein [Promicromonospora citrea]GGM41386.1 hypothetical protein GCM10010102_41130 [Promicromonospora citrea]
MERAEDAADDAATVHRASRLLRPVGYLLIGLVWTAIWLTGLLLLLGSVAWLAFADPEPLVEGVGERLSHPVEAVAFVVIVLPVAAVAIGPGAWYVLTASWPLAVLSFVYVVRSLRPSYAHEKLSFTSYALPGSTFGPPTVGGVALSLQPVRPTSFTDTVMRFYRTGWTFSGRMVLAMLPAGLAWVTAIAALVRGVPDTVHVVAAVLTAALLGVSLVLGRRAFRAQAEPEVPEHERSVGAMSPKERARRLRALRRQRDRRQRNAR